jgi:hypothetical protein
MNKPRWQIQMEKQHYLSPFLFRTLDNSAEEVGCSLKIQVQGKLSRLAINRIFLEQGPALRTFFRKRRGFYRPSNCRHAWITIFYMRAMRARMGNESFFHEPVLFPLTSCGGNKCAKPHSKSVAFIAGCCGV